MATYFQTDDGYIAATDEHPVGFKGAALVGRDQLGDRVFMVADLRKLPQVALADVPDGWVRTLGYDEPVPAPVVYEPVFDLEGEELLDLYPVAVAPRRRVSQPVDGIATEREIGLVIGVACFLVWLVFFR